MFDRWMAFFTKPGVLLALLIFQSFLYWAVAIFQGSEAVPVAYQRF